VHRAAAIKLISPEVRSNDAPTSFIAGRMLDEGICVQRDPELAAYFFAHAAELGERAAVLDYAGKVGLGIGTEEDFTRAGELCRTAGVDRENRLSTPAVHVTAAPRVGRSEPTTGSYLRQPLIDASQEVAKAWRQAVSMVPAPAAAHTEAQSADLSIDVDMTLEQGHEKLPRDLQRLTPGDVHPTVTTNSHT
jgi:TPR repeat protein